MKYNRKYTMKNIEEFRRHNGLYDGIEGDTFYLAYLKVGERGWILHHKNEYDWPHRIHTSVIQAVKYKDYQVIVLTENTKFTFEVVDEYGLLNKQATDVGD